MSPIVTTNSSPAGRIRRVKGPAGGGGGGPNHAIFANAPAVADGWTVVTDWDCSSVPPIGSNNAAGWRFYERTADDSQITNMTTATDATQPGSNTDVLRTLYTPGTFAGGNTPVLAVLSGFPAGKTEMYFAYTVRYSANWVAENFLAKHFYFGARAGVGNQNHHNGVNTDGGGQYTINPQMNADGGYSTTHITNSTNLQDGAWHDIETQITYNTGSNTDGIAYVWTDSVSRLIGNGSYGAANASPRTDLFLSVAGSTKEMNNLQWEPYYGGGIQVPDEEMHIDLGHILVMVR